MSTPAQQIANQANAQKSTGPTSPEGKAISSKNNLRHGLTGPFVLLNWERREDYEALRAELFAEHQPKTLTEEMLVENMVQSYWLRKRAIILQTMCFREDTPAADFTKQLSLYLRYQTTHERAFYKALHELQKLRAQTRKEEREEAALSQRAEDARIGFVSQQRQEERREAQEKRRENEEDRRQELHQARVWLTQAQARRHETEKVIAEALKMPRNSVPQAA